MTVEVLARIGRVTEVSTPPATQVSAELAEVPS
jgi:hypothetical protein